MKKSLGNKPLIYPQPVLVIATYNEDGTANAMTAAWGGVCDYSKISIIIDKGHKTAKNLKERKAFTLSIADLAHIKEADFLGIVSGNKTPDKVLKAKLSTSKSKNVDAPILDDFPLTLECKLISYDEITERAIGEVINTLADESILTEGKIDLLKFKPLVYDSMNHHYLILGEKVGEAFKDGNSLK